MTKKAAKNKPKWCKYCLKYGIEAPNRKLGMCKGHYMRYFRDPNISEDELSAPVGPRRKSLVLDSSNAARRTEMNQLRVVNQELQSRVTELLKTQVFDKRYQEFVAKAVSRPLVTPNWVISITKHKPYMVMPTVHLSDLHLDEVIEASQVDNLNGYDRPIAEQRLRNFFERTADVAFNYLQGFRYPGIIMPMGGDNFPGDIHEELKETNADTTLSSMLYWVKPVVSGIKFFADTFGKVYVPAVVGNHGRNTKKPIYKNKVRNNFDWLWMHMLAREFEGDKRVTFNISEASDFSYYCYNTKYVLTHGDQARGGSGISAQWAPLGLLAARKRKRINFDYLICGHWHQLGKFMNVRVNGSLKGYDEYAYDKNYDYQPPLQDFWVTDPRRGIICEFPIHCMSRKEPWQKPVDKRTEPYDTKPMSFRKK